MGNETGPQREYERHTSGEAATKQEDVLLDVPILKVEALELDVSDLRARVSLQAEVLNLLRLNVGIDAVLGQVRLDIRGVEAQALLKVRLDNVADILNRVLSTIEAHPEIIEPLVRSASVALAGTGSGQLSPGRATLPAPRCPTTGRVRWRTHRTSSGCCAPAPSSPTNTPVT
jgi:hypothetical protein